MQPPAANSGPPSVPNIEPPLPTTSFSSRSDPIIPTLPTHTIAELSNSHNQPNISFPTTQNPWNKNNPRTKERKIRFEDIIYDPTLTDADYFVMKNEIWTKGEIHWKHCIVGFVPGWKPNFKSIEKYAIPKWGSYGLHSVTQLRKGVFLFRFSNDEQVEAVLEKKTWTFYERPFILQKWSDAAEVDPLNLKSVPVWVTLPNPHLNLWSAEALGLMASTLGKPVAFDYTTTNLGTTEFAKICVILNAAHRRKDAIRFTTEDGVKIVQEVVYEWFPDHCKNCQVFGHTMESCPKNPSTTAQPSSPPRSAQYPVPPSSTIQPSSPPRYVQQIPAPPTPNVHTVTAPKSHHPRPPLTNKPQKDSTPTTSSFTPVSVPPLSNVPVTLINHSSPPDPKELELPSSPNRFHLLQNEVPDISEFPPIPPSPKIQTDSSSTSSC